MWVNVHRDINAPPEVIWELLVDLDAWPQWGPSISRAELDPTFQQLTSGATGVVHTSLLVTLPFVVTDFEPGRCWAWKVAGVSATWHRVDPVAAGARVTFGVPWWAPGYLAVCSIALRRIEKLAVEAATTG